MKRKVFQNENVIPCDIDDTIVLYDPEAPGGKITIQCPHSLHGEWELKKHEPHIRLVKEKLARGCIMIVWSQGGYAWANAVLEALGLDHENIHVYTKPNLYIDDKEAGHWMGPRLYLPPDSLWTLPKPKTNK